MTEFVEWQEIEPLQEPRYGVLGSPIAHSLSPQMQNAALKALQPEARYLAIHVQRQDFQACLGHLATCGFRGVNVTLPHKEAAAALTVPDDDIVEKVHAANTLKFENPKTLARNTDAAAFFAPLSDVLPRDALILGAGGAAATATYSLLRNGWATFLYNRTPERAHELAQRMSAFGKCRVMSKPDPASKTLIVNATSIGLKPDEMPQLMWENVSPEMIFYDLAYREHETDFLARAKSHGHRTIDGREMLVEQGALALEWWLGKTAPRELMRREIGI